jgi:hypothetical protein
MFTVQSGAEILGIGWVSFGRYQGCHFPRKKNSQQILSVNKKYIVIITLKKDILTYTCKNFDTLSLQICKFIL